MGTLRIDLQDGFDNDDVCIKVNGREVYHHRDVTTKLLLGLADTIETKAEDGSAVVEITVPTRKLSRTDKVDVKGDTYVGACVQRGGLRLLVSSTPFGYG